MAARGKQCSASAAVVECGRRTELLEQSAVNRNKTMGWEIHITRADFWPDSHQAPITSEEWLELVKADPELTIDPRDNGPYFALWLSHRVDGDHPWFDWFEGVIST